MRLIITYEAHSDGYTVQTLTQRSRILRDSYEAGNHPCDSQGGVSIYDSTAVPLATLWKWAKQTAEEIAQEQADLGHKVITERVCA